MQEHASIKPLPPLLIAGMGLMGFASLMPNHYWPWLSFHADAVAALATTLLVLSAMLEQGKLTEWPKIALWILATSFIPLIQAFFGLIFFWGDAWLAFLYLSGLAFSIYAGAVLTKTFSKTKILCLFWSVTVFSAITSAGIAISQCFMVSGLGIFAAELPFGGRPFANVAQPNQLATILVLGLVGAYSLKAFEKIGKASLFLIIAYLSFVIVITASRAAWLELGLVALSCVAIKYRFSVKIDYPSIAAPILVFLIFTTLWPSTSELLYLRSGRTLQEQAAAGTRPTHWVSMIDAIWRQPWFGYGWNQVAVAQSRVAADHAFTGEAIEHSHNLVLDLLVWNGVPIGTLLVSTGIGWVVCRIRACNSSDVLLAFTGVLAVMTHEMLEFPLEYAYLLLPVGFLVGIIDEGATSPTRLKIPLRVSTALAGSVAILVACVISDYIQLEDEGRELRFEMARIGTAPGNVTSSHVILLTQLQNLFLFGRAPLTSNAKAGDIIWAKKVAERFPYSANIFRYATLSGINGKPEESKRSLKLLCTIYSHETCASSKEEWTSLSQGKYPDLRLIPWPTDTH